MYTGVPFQEMGINHVVLLDLPAIHIIADVKVHLQMSHQLRTVVALGGSQCFRAGNSGFERWKNYSAWLRLSREWFAEGCWWEDSITQLLTAHLGGRPWYVLTAYKCNKLSVMFQKPLLDDSSSAHQGRNHQEKSARCSQRGGSVSPRVASGSIRVSIFHFGNWMMIMMMCPRKKKPFVINIECM